MKDIGRLVDERLVENGLTRENLTRAELERLYEEVREEQNGGVVLDGVLSDQRFCSVLGRDKDLDALQEAYTMTQKRIAEAKAAGDEKTVAALEDEVASINRKVMNHKRFMRTIS